MILMYGGGGDWMMRSEVRGKSVSINTCIFFVCGIRKVRRFEFGWNQSQLLEEGGNTAAIIAKMGFRFWNDWIRKYHIPTGHKCDNKSSEISWTLAMYFCEPMRNRQSPKSWYILHGLGIFISIIACRWIALI